MRESSRWVRYTRNITTKKVEYRVGICAQFPWPIRATLKGAYFQPNCACRIQIESLALYYIHSAVVLVWKYDSAIRKNIYIYLYCCWVTSATECIGRGYPEVSPIRMTLKACFYLGPSAQDQFKYLDGVRGCLYGNNTIVYLTQRNMAV